MTLNQSPVSPYLGGMQPVTSPCRLHLHGHHERIVLMDSCNYKHNSVNIWQPSIRAEGEPVHNLKTLVGNAFDSLAPDKHFHRRLQHLTCQTFDTLPTHLHNLTYLSHFTLLQPDGPGMEQQGPAGRRHALVAHDPTRCASASMV